MGIRNDDGSFVYFMRPIGMDGPIKIGCSYRPADRLEAYNQISPMPLEIVAVMAGDQRLEGRFHARFEHLRSHHEWFRSDAELTATVEMIRAGCYCISVLPERGSPARSQIAKRTWAARKAAA